jgi:hypothetical protein
VIAMGENVDEHINSIVRELPKMLPDKLSKANSLINEFKKLYNDFLTFNNVWEQQKHIRILVSAYDYLKEAIKKLDELSDLAKDVEDQNFKQHIINLKNTVLVVKMAIEKKLVDESKKM